MPLYFKNASIMKGFEGMKKVGILTIHKAYNYGAFMQAYSLQRCLQSIFTDAQVEIIDYSQLTDRVRYEITLPIWTILHYGFRAAIQLIRKYAAFRKSWKYLKTSKKRIIANSSKQLDKTISCYDVIIVGSDAVFNDSGYKDLSPFYLAKVKGPSKYSYAASAHGMDFRAFSSKKREAIGEALSEFRILGSRDSHTDSFIEYCTHDSSKTVHCCDPTIILDMAFPEEGIIKKLKSAGVDKENKCIIVMLKNEAAAKLFRSICGSKYRIVAVASPCKYADVFLGDLTPFEWGHVFEYAYMTITDYFHGTIMSLKNCTPVLSIDPLMRTQKFDTKLYDLLNRRLQLSEFYYYKGEISTQEGMRRFKDQIANSITANYAKRINKAIHDEGKCFADYIAMLREQENC